MCYPLTASNIFKNNFIEISRCRVDCKGEKTFTKTSATEQKNNEKIDPKAVI